MFNFALFAFYTLIFSYYICCFSVHLIAKLFTQLSVFNVFDFLFIFIFIYLFYLFIL